MRRIPVDTTRVNFIGSGKVAARAQYAELSDGSRRRVPDAQDTNEHGVPLWVVDVYLDDDEADRAEVVSVKVASYDEPKNDKLKPIKFVNLVALGYVQQGTSRVAYSFTADGIEGQGGKAHQQPAA